MLRWRSPHGRQESRTFLTPSRRRRLSMGPSLRWGDVLMGRQPDLELRASLARDAAYRPPACVQQRPCDGEAEAGSAFGAAAGVEGLEDAFAVGGGDAGAVVAHGDPRSTRLRRGSDHDL